LAGLAGGCRAACRFDPFAPECRHDAAGEQSAEQFERLPPWHLTRQDASRFIENAIHTNVPFLSTIRQLTTMTK
jgi:hypothetical protein